MSPKFFLTLLGAATLLITPSHSGEEQRRLVGYANGQPLYVTGAPRVRSTGNGNAGQTRRVYVQASAPRVNVGSYGTYHGPIQSGARNYGGAYADAWSNGYAGGYGYGYGYGNNGYGWGGSWNGHGNGSCRPMTNIYPGANRAGYISIPRYR